LKPLKRPLVVATTGGWVVVGGTKALTNHEINQRRRNGTPLEAPNLCLVPVDTIYEPIAAIPDEGGSPGDFLFIRSADNWGYGFTQLIEDNEPAELKELEGNNACPSDEEDDDDEGEKNSSDDQPSDSSHIELHSESSVGEV